MKYLASYLLAVLSGKTSPDSSDIERILESVGIEHDPKSIDLILKTLKGKKIDDLINEGMQKLTLMPSGGVSSTAAVESSVVTVTSQTEDKKDEKKSEKEESDSDDDLGLGLFD